MTQEQVLDILKTGENVFLTGPPGSGKTHLLNDYIKYLRDNDVSVAVTASTGIAATHMSGRTIHSWSGMGIKDILTEKHLNNLKRRKYIRDRMRSASVLIIDEISMLHSYQLDMVDNICKVIRQSVEPFGGLQLVCSGDFFQLPPVKSKESQSGKWAAESMSWNNTDIKTCYLTEQYRHRDKDLIYVLERIRNDEVTNKVKKLLLERIDADIKSDIEPVKLYTHNNMVDSINAVELNKIDKPIVEFKMKSDGNENLIKTLENSCLSPKILQLKEGARVMFTKNNFDKGYINGTMGVIRGFEDDRNYPIVEIFDGKTVTTLHDIWKVENEQGEVLAKIIQIPLRLAWAVTVHKSQGMTLDSAEIDLSKAFEEGMGYVALSRIKSLNNLRLKGFNDTALKVSDKALGLDKQFKKSSENLINFMSDLSNIKKKQKKFLKNSKKQQKKKYSISDNSKFYINPANLPF